MTCFILFYIKKIFSATRPTRHESTAPKRDLYIRECAAREKKQKIYTYNIQVCVVYFFVGTPMVRSPVALASPLSHVPIYTCQVNSYLSHYPNLIFQKIQPDFCYLSRGQRSEVPLLLKKKKKNKKTLSYHHVYIMRCVTDGRHTLVVYFIDLVLRFILYLQCWRRLSRDWSGRRHIHKKGKKLYGLWVFSRRQTRVIIYTILRFIYGVLTVKIYLYNKQLFFFFYLNILLLTSYISSLLDNITHWVINLRDVIRGYSLAQLWMDVSHMSCKKSAINNSVRELLRDG